MEDPKTAVLANLGALVALGPLAPLPFGVRSRRHASLAGEVGHDAVGNVLTAIRKAPIELESFEQDGETEPGGACLIGKEIILVCGQRPMLGEFVRVPVLLHGR
jgi:hypothetical protein